MDPFTSAALLGGGASLLGGFLTNSSNAKTAAKQMQFEAGQAQMNRDFQERMSGSAHQREVTDLRAAGLNPILSATGGPGASTPTGAKGAGAGFPAVNAVENSVHSALAVRRAKSENRNIEEDTKLKTEQLRAMHENIYERKWATTLLETQNQSEMARRDALRDLRPGQRKEREIDETDYGSALRYMDRSMNSARTIGGILGGMRGR